jgi:hypothetical protein
MVPKAVVATTPIMRTRAIDLTTEGFYQAVLDEPVEWNEACKALDEYLQHYECLPTGLGTPFVR